MKNGNKIKGSFLLSGLAQQKMQINTCTPCHLRGTEILNTSEVSAEIMDHFIPEIPSSEFFYADGQVKDEDYTYTSFLQSKMYSRGVKCSNCHNSHSGKILYAGNQLCLQCHSKKYDEVMQSIKSIIRSFGDDARNNIRGHDYVEMLSRILIDKGKKEFAPPSVIRSFFRLMSRNNNEILETFV